jgi:hypothetical protein
MAEHWLDDTAKSLGDIIENDNVDLADFSALAEEWQK